MRTTMSQLSESVESGSTFSEALSLHPGVFNKLYVNMVKAGELGGVLEIVLIRLAEFQEKSQKIKGKVLSAMIYPLVVLIIAGLILTFLLIFIVPKFQQIFNDALPGVPLPGVTLFVIACSDFFSQQMVPGISCYCRCRYRFQSNVCYSSWYYSAGSPLFANTHIWRSFKQDRHCSVQSHTGYANQQRCPYSPSLKHYP